MADQDLRLECLKLASTVSTGGSGIIGMARQFYEFATNTDKPAAPNGRPAVAGATRIDPLPAEYPSEPSA